MPVLQFRIEGRHTESDEAWAKTFGMLKECPGLCDEVWFGTGFGMPTLEKHREYAARIGRASKDVASLGWTASLMFQATIGHGGPFCAGYDYSGRHWTGWTGSTGVEDKYCSCPRDPRFLAYMRAVARIYAANHPASVWIDDDLRIDNHDPATRSSIDGCWCKTCIADFNAETSGKWTRETLAAAARKDVRLRVAYEEFAIRSVAAIARAIAEEFHAVSPETMLAIQHGTMATRTINAIVDAFRDVCGAPVGYRLGTGAYYDVNPNEQILKSLSATRCRRDFKRPERISLWTSEIACFPRTYGSKSAQTIIMEGFTGLVFGLDAASALVVNYGKESEEVYLRTRLKPMADAAPVFRAYAKSCAGTVPAGFASDAQVNRLYAFAQCGVPVLFGPGKTLGTFSKDEIAFDRCRATSTEVQKLRDALDARAGGTPTVLESPFVGLMMPRVAADGSLRNVALLGLRLDEQGPVRLRLRGVPENATCAVWREIRRDPVTLPIRREGGVCRVEVPSIGVWNGGFLEFRFKAVDTSIPEPENVPELMRTFAGVAVDTKDAWEKVRAPELLERFQKDVYGRRPSAANERGRVSFKTYDERATMGGKAVRKLVRAEFDGPFGKFSFPFTVYIPKAEKPVPAFVSICLKVRSKVDADHAISSECWPVERIVARGFATAGFLTEDVATEKNTGFSHGVFKCMEKVETRDDESWGAISAWAWAASRVMDWIETEPAIDAARVGIVGHSRGGKTAIWTGATDRRFALVCSNDSGAHGAKLNHIRLPRSEDIASIPKNFPNWYCGNYPKKYGGREMSMDFDQHELLALVAPRLLCVGSASADYWAGPRGEWWSAKLASPAWELYGRRGLAAKAFPAPGETQQDGDVSYHLRPGRHFLAPYDWDRYMDFAAKLSDGGSGLSALPVAKPPRDAVALFDGTQESFDANWTDMKGRKAKWKFVDGTIEATRGAGDIRTRREFGDVQLHVEWQVPADLPPYDMNSGNSGVFMMGLYEVQIFESHETDPADMKHPFYADGQAASIYGQNPPLVNPARRRGEWQTYDIVFYRPVFDGATCVRPGSVTAFLNGVLVQDGWPLEGPTGHIRRTRQTKPPSDKGPVKLQQHLCPVRFRNVWIRELPEGTRNMRPASGRSAAVERSVGNAVAGRLRPRTDCSTIYAP